MNHYSMVFLMASAALTMTACIQGSGPGDSSSTSNNGPLPGSTPIGKVNPGSLPEPTQAGEDFFNTKVIPAMNEGALGACTNCHATGSLGAPRFLSGASEHDRYLNVRNYRDGALIQPPSTNLFLAKGQHEGPDLSGTQFGLIKQWAQLENPSNNQAPNQSFFDELRAFAKCMNFDQFKNEKLDTLAVQKVVGNLTCADCHADPNKGPGLFINNNAQQTFDQLKKFPNILKIVGAKVANTGAFLELQATNRLIDKGEEYDNCSAQDVININFNTADPNYCHPNYALDDQFQQQIEDFVRNTLNDSKNGGLCQDRN